MSYLLTRRAGLDPRYTGQLRIPRREFGTILFALTGNTLPPNSYRVDNEVFANSPHAPLGWTSGTVMTAVMNNYGRAIRFPDTGSTSRSGWSVPGGVSSWLTADTDQLTVVFLGRAIGNLANNRSWVYLADADGYTGNLCGFTGSTQLHLLQGRPARNQTQMIHNMTVTGGQYCSAVLSWRGGDKMASFLNGVSNGTIDNPTATLEAGVGGYINNGLGAAPSYAIGIECNLCLVGRTAIPSSLAQDISSNAWDAFEPVRKAFYFSGAADSTAPTWTGGSVITASSVTHAAFDLSWPAANDDTAVTQYRYRVDAGSWTNTGTTRTASLSALTAGTAYDIEVEAGDAADNWSTALELTVTTQSIKVNPSIYDPAAGTARASQTGLGMLVLAEKPGSTATPTVLAYSATETTDGSGVLDVNLNTAGVDPGDVVWVVIVKSDGVPANAGYSLCWPVTVVAV